MTQELQMIEKMEKNDKLVREKYSMLREKYGNEFVAIDNGKVLEHAKNMKELEAQLKVGGIDLTYVLIQFISAKGMEILF